jgi:hypothetical protein
VGIVMELYNDVQNEARSEEDDHGELVTVVWFVYFCFVFNNFLSVESPYTDDGDNFFFLHRY